MTAVYGYVEANNYRYKDDFNKALIESKKMWKPDAGTITDVLKDHPFMEVLKVGGYGAFFGDSNSSFTLFVPETVPPKSQIDALYAHNVVRFSTLPTSADLALIAQRPYLSPILNGSRLYVYNKYGKLYLNEACDPVEITRPNVYTTNGIIHFVARPLIPPFPN